MPRLSCQTYKLIKARERDRERERESEREREREHTVYFHHYTVYVTQRTTQHIIIIISIYICIY